MFLIDAPRKWTSAVAAISDVRNLGTASANAAVFFPRLGGPDSAPCGAIAGVFARTDAGDGVWNAPAGTGTTVVGASGTTIALSEPDIRKLNGAGINCLRSFPTSSAVVVWGARTMQGAGSGRSDWKYIPVRRLALFMETSIDRGTQWATFEPNGRVPGLDSATGVLRKMRRHDHDAGRQGCGAGEYHRRIRAIEACGVRDP